MRLAVVADIHGNLPALEAVAADLRGRAVDAVLDLGDIVSGPLWPRETLDLLRTLGWPGVRGKHDRRVGAADAATLSRTDAYAAAEVGEEGRRWLGSLPHSHAPLAGVSAWHARPQDDDAYLLEDVVDGSLRPARPETVAHRLPGVGSAVILTAHSHQAGLVRLPDGRAVVNPGSVGCPAYSDPAPPAHVSETRDPSAHYAVLHLEASENAPKIVAAEFVALMYDYGSAVRRALSLGRSDWRARSNTGQPARAEAPLWSRVPRQRWRSLRRRPIPSTARPIRPGQHRIRTARGPLPEASLLTAVSIP